MPYVDDPDDNSEGSVAGPNPFSQGAAQESYDSASDANQASSMGSAAIQGGNVDQAQSQGTTTTNKKAPKASSGMFTNIQKYVDKNKPQAQKMAGAVTQDFSKQASEIRQAAESKKADQDKVLNENERLMTQATGQAQAAVNQIMGTQQEQPQYEAASAQQFQDLMKGNLAGKQQVGDLNIAQQQMRTDALAQLAGGAQTEQGRRNLLGQTFRKQGEYSRGMSGLDNLITSGDQAAREGLVQGTQGTAKDLESRLGGISETAAGNKSAQDLALRNLAGDVTGIASGAQKGIDTDIQTAYEAELAARKGLLDPESEEYKAAIAGAQGRLGEISGAIGTGEGYSGLGKYADYLQKYARSDWGSNIGINQYLQRMRDFSKTGEIQTRVREPYKNAFGNTRHRWVIKPLKGDEALNYLNSGGGLGMSHHKDRTEVAQLTDALNKNLLGTDKQGLYGLDNLKAWSGSTYSPTTNRYQAAQIMNNFRNLQKQRDDLGSADDIIRRKLGEVGKVDYDKLAAGEDISKYDLSSKEQIDKINALKGLMGQQDVLTDQQIGDRKYASMQSLQDILKAYGG